VIYNGVDLKIFTPRGRGERPEDLWRILVVEGSLMGGYELGLETAIALAAEIVHQQKAAHSRLIARDIELQVVGRVSPEAQIKAERRVQNSIRLHWAGIQPVESIPEIDRSAHILFSSDLNAACPNSVIEALGCGLPVLAFDTGALPDMVAGDAGRVVPYGGDPWRLDQPDVPALAGAALEILEEQERFRSSARLRAEAAFDLEDMTDAYLDVLLGD
jgi:glycosyltransferase involved in cell wall biosynthesis